jgi:tripartite-type tricarboxylate transporter receptor subunit TctC
VPVGTPRAAVNKLFAATRKVLADPEVIERYNLGAALVMTSKSPEDFAAFMKTQTEFWSKLVTQLGAVEQ